MIPQFLRQIVPLALLAVSCSKGGGEWISEDAGVSFRLPDRADWRLATNTHTQAKLTLHGPDSSVVFIVFEPRSGEVLNEALVKRWEEEFYSSGWPKKVSGEFLTFKGRPAYKAVAKKSSDEVVETWVVILWLENDRIVEIATTRDNADPLDDPVIKEFVGSIRFLHNPANSLVQQPAPAKPPEAVR